MINTKDFYDYLIEKGYDFFAGVPDSLLKDFCSCVGQNAPANRRIVAANEGSAIGICAGYHLATSKCGVVYMQNSGEGNAVNPLISLADPEVYSIPMLLLIGWRGEPGTADEPQHKKQGRITLKILDALEIEYIILEDDYKNQINYCSSYIAERNRPIAIVVRKGVFSEYEGAAKQPSELPLTREQALESILGELSQDDLVVSTTGKTSREIFELREKTGFGHANDFLTVGSMGHTASIALGLSLATDKNVWCIDGDGSFLMHMGSFAVAAQAAGENFKYILNNNGAHESVGGQPTVGFDIDVPKILAGCGFETVHEAQTPDEIKAAVEQMKTEKLAALVIKTKQGSRKDLGRPTVAPQQNKWELMKKIRG